jgi:hypothetical protein
MQQDSAGETPARLSYSVYRIAIRWSRKAHAQGWGFSSHDHPIQSGAVRSGFFELDGKSLGSFFTTARLAEPGLFNDDGVVRDCFLDRECEHDARRAGFDHDILATQIARWLLIGRESLGDHRSFFAFLQAEFQDDGIVSGGVDT